jgi:hypothetical protein
MELYAGAGPHWPGAARDPRIDALRQASDFAKQAVRSNVTI